MRTIFLLITLPLSLLISQPSITSPESFFGFKVGKGHLRPDHIVSYLKALDQASDRVTLEEYGQTYEGRPLVLLTITSPENHRNLQALKEQHRALCDPSRSATVDIEDLPVVIWMGYSVHGNEASGSNASVRVAYYLASTQGPEIERTLKETIILIDPMINPDGLARFTEWVTSHNSKNPTADPNNREHNEAWPGGRSNHYWFDLNRDWMPLQHPESKARLAKYYEWMPNVLTDHHEMGTNATFFFQPGEPARNNPLTPKDVDELTEKIARYHAQALDHAGSLYYSHEDYDDFYIGKGSSYPDITGGIGILFEQASSRGLLQESVNGTLSFEFTVRNQFTTSLSTLTAADALRKELLAHQRDFFASALREAERSLVKGYVFGSATDPWRTYYLLDILRRHQIDVYGLTRQLRADGQTFDPGSAFVVPTSQKQFRLITSLFERRTKFADSLFYDVSAWTLPLAFDLPSAELKTVSREALGTRVELPVPPKGALIGSPSEYAYVFEWHSYYAPRALYRLQKAEIKTKVAARTFEAVTSEGKRTFDYGAIMISVGIQKERVDTIRKIIETITREDGVRVYAFSTGFSDGGIDLGSPNFAALQIPRAMIVVGPGVSSTDVGEAWHLLDQRFDMEVSLDEATALGRIDLSRYNVITMVGGNYAGIDSAGLASLRRWVENGGTLVTMEQASQWAVTNRLATGQFRRDDAARGDSTTPRLAYADEETYSGAREIPGSIFEAIGDRTHPLLYGYDTEKLSVFKSNTIFMQPSRNPYATPLVYSQEPLLSGYLHKSYDKLIKGSAAIVVSALRSGRVILMADDPNFRAFWYGTNKLYLNCLFFGQLLRPSRMRGEE
jgi:hypothetical protein